MGVLLLLITTICAVTSRYRSDCTDVLFELAPCLDYVTDASTCPSLDCCKQFTNVIKTRPLCLCAVFDGTASKLLGVPIDTDRAINLPEACQEEEEEEEELSQALPTCKCSCRISFYQTLACVGTNSSTFITESSSSSKKSSPCRATTCWNSMRRW